MTTQSKPDRRAMETFAKETVRMAEENLVATSANTERYVALIERSEALNILVPWRFWPKYLALRRDHRAATRERERIDAVASEIEKRRAVLAEWMA